MNSPVNAHLENVLLTVILQLLVIIAASRIFGMLFRKLGQPQVCGEIAAGLILGPSLLGGLFPGTFAKIFDPAVGQVFGIMGQIGLVLMMFLIGLEFDFGHLKENRRTALSVSVAGIVLPFALGLVLGQWMHLKLGMSGSRLNFALFMAAAMSITAIPVLGRIILELRINRTRIGSLTISAAAVGDAVGWIILALITAIVRSQLDPVKMWVMVGEVAGFMMIMMLVVRPLLKRWLRRIVSSGELSLNSLAIILILVFVAAIATNLIGIFSIFGAFLLGAILYDEPQLVQAVRRRLTDFVTVFFLPIFFTYTGLRTDAGTMTGAGMWALCATVTLTATVGKLGGCGLAARVNGVPWRESAIIGVMMNTRGLVELIVVNMGYDLGIIPQSVFFMLVLMALVTTYMTAPLLRRLIPTSELEADYRRSEFAARRAS